MYFVNKEHKLDIKLRNTNDTMKNCGQKSQYFNKQYLVLDPQFAGFVEKHEHSRNSIHKDWLFNLIFNEFITTKKGIFTEIDRA